MVQHLVVPWRDRRELLQVRQQFYPERTPTSAAAKADDAMHNQQQQQHHAVARVAMWMHRGNCPHLVESTALLTAAVLSDRLAAGLAMRATEPAVLVTDGDGVVAGEGGREDVAMPSNGYAVRAAYSAAFSRFVTGLLDSHQDKQRKMSMYAVAKSVGLPATFVELRHQATHEELPSAIRLRAAAKKALDWIWEHYWRHLPDGGDDPAGAKAQDEEVRRRSVCRDLVMRYLELDDGAQKASLLREIKKRDEDEVMQVLRDVWDSATSGGLQRGAIALLREVLRDDGAMELDRENVQEDDKPLKDVGLVREEMARIAHQLAELEKTPMDPNRGVAVGRDEDEDENGPAWSRYEVDKWIPKPIGIV